MSASFPHITIRRAAADALDTLVYAHAGGAAEFGCRASAAPVAVWIPRGHWWTQRVPAWALDRRDAIVADVRAWGAIVYESELDANCCTTTTIASPDQTFRIECSVEPDDRAAPWERTRIVAADGEVLAYFSLHAVEGLIAFPRPGAVDLNLLGRYGERELVHVDVSRRTFYRNGDPAFVRHPLTAIDAILGPVRHSAAAPARPVAARRPAFEAMTGVIGVPFALGGLWLSFAGKTPSDRLAGIGGMLMGGFAARNAIAELRRRPRSKATGDGSAKMSKVPSRLAAFVPLLAIGVELLWLGMLLMAFLFALGDKPYTHTPGSASVRLLDFIAALPALAGLLFGIDCIARRRAQSLIEWACLFAGVAGCALFVLVFGREFFH